MPSIITSRAPGIAAAVARPPDGETSWSAVPWITVALPQARRAVLRGDDRGELARGAGGMNPAVEAATGGGAQELGLAGVDAGADPRVRGDEVLDIPRAVRARPAKQVG
jgi:hypothetical protein